jgi:hypothetical protein
MSGRCCPPEIFWIAIVQKADSSSLFDDLDAAVRSGASESRVAMLRRITNPFANEADCPRVPAIGAIYPVVAIARADFGS